MKEHKTATRSAWGLAVAAFLWSTLWAAAQETPAPPLLKTSATDTAPAGEFASQFASAAEHTADPTVPLPLVEAIRFDATWLPDLGKQGLGVTELELGTTLLVPCLGDAAPLRFTPGFATRLWDGPSSSAGVGRPDMPPQTYDLYLDCGWRPRLARWLFADLGITPGLYTDFREVNADSFRLRGRGLAIVAFSEQLQLMAGVLYVNRNNTKVLPAGGLVWSPDERTRCELVFPQPKISRQLVAAEARQVWGYVAGEFGGGAWTIERAGGYGDSVDYRDIRVFLGLEWREAGHKGRIEMGYVFNRRLDYVSATPNFDPRATLMLRAGFSW
jgi:hypothetical protein